MTGWKIHHEWVDVWILLKMVIFQYSAIRMGGGCLSLPTSKRIIARIPGNQPELKVNVTRIASIFNIALLVLPVAPPPLPPYLGQVGGNRYKRKNAWRFDDLFASLLSWDLLCLDLCWFVCLNYSNWFGLDLILTCMFELLGWADCLVPGPWHGALSFGAMRQCFPHKKSTNRRQRIGGKMTIHQSSSISDPKANIAPFPRLKDGGWKMIPSFSGAVLYCISFWGVLQTCPWKVIVL